MTTSPRGDRFGLDPADGGRMKCACLVYVAESILDAMPDSEWNTLLDQHLQNDTELSKSGHFLLGQAEL